MRETLLKIGGKNGLLSFFFPVPAIKLVFMNKLSTAVIGASGYTGMEAVRLLWHHRGAGIKCVVSQNHVGEALSELMGPSAPDMKYSALDAPEIEDCEVIFSCLPHGTGIEKIREWRRKGKVVIDLSADFRLTDPQTYEKWYGVKHTASDLLKEAVYGMPELNRDALRKADLIACPGCYPTAAILGLLPVLETGWIKHDVIINAISGVSGAGRSMKTEHSFVEVNENVYAYATPHHRHTPEIEQELARAASHEVSVVFTPHIGPFNRGIYTTIYTQTTIPRTEEDARQLYTGFYEGEPFVKILADNPQLNHVRDTNFCYIRPIIGSRGGKLVILSVIDNLMKGAAGQAVQCFNLRFGFDETEGLLAPLPS